MIYKGTNIERVRVALGDIGGSVINGAFSTFLAVSNSYVFRVFFKQFFGIVIFGVLHGLVLLPVLLALYGPKPYSTAKHSNDQLINDNNEKDEKNISKNNEVEIAMVKVVEKQSAAEESNNVRIVI